MTKYSLPIGDTVDSTYRIQLEGDTYNFRFRWNSYDESWKCYVGFLGEDPVASFKMTHGFNLLESYSYLDGVPDAVMVVADTVVQSGRPDKDNIGNNSGDRYKVFLVTSEE